MTASFSPIAMSQHLLRLRDNIYSNVSTIGTNATYDPSSVAISAGATLYASIRGVNKSPIESEVPECASKLSIRMCCN
jgi:hypothetical protein